MAAFLEVLTRCYKRPGLLANNIASINAQSIGDWEQVLFVDEVGMGVPAAQAQFADYEPAGEYVWILDDDDMCIHPHLVRDLLRIRNQSYPDVIMLKMDHAHRGILPDLSYWGGYPTESHIGCSAYVVSKRVWMAHRHAWKPGRYQSDLDFIQSVFDGGWNIYWHDVIASKVQRISLGAAE